MTSPLKIKATLDDPNYLTLLMRGLERKDSSNERERGFTFSGNHKQRQQRILDSLASALVSTERGEIVLVGVALSGSTPSGSAVSSDVNLNDKIPDPVVRLYVANNKDITDATVEHLNYILAALRSAQNPSQGFSPVPSTFLALDGGRRVLAQLELRMIEHSWKKIRRRFIKNDRPTYFLQTAAAAQEISSPNTKATQYDLRQLSMIRENVKLLITKKYDLTQLVNALTRLFEISVPDEEELDTVRLFLHGVFVCTETLQKQEEFVRNWNGYTSCMFLLVWCGYRVSSTSANI